MVIGEWLYLLVYSQLGPGWLLVGQSAGQQNQVCAVLEEVGYLLFDLLLNPVASIINRGIDDNDSVVTNVRHLFIAEPHLEIRVFFRCYNTSIVIFVRVMLLFYTFIGEY